MLQMQYGYYNPRIQSAIQVPQQYAPAAQRNYTLGLQSKPAVQKIYVPTQKNIFQQPKEQAVEGFKLSNSVYLSDKQVASQTSDSQEKAGEQISQSQKKKTTGVLSERKNDELNQIRALSHQSPKKIMNVSLIVPEAGKKAKDLSKSQLVAQRQTVNVYFPSKGTKCLTLSRIIQPGLKQFAHQNQVRYISNNSARAQLSPHSSPLYRTQTRLVPQSQASYLRKL